MGDEGGATPRSPLELESSTAPAAPSASYLRRLLNAAVTPRAASGASWVANVTLLAVKAFIFAFSNSKAVLAALADSAVDLASQLLLEVRRARK